MERDRHFHHYKNIIAGLILMFCLAKVVDAQDPLVCEDGKGYYSSETDGECVTVFNEPLTWSEAQSRCNEIVEYGKLVIVDDSDNQELLSGIIQRTEGGDGDYWLGISDITKEGNFKYMNSDGDEYVHGDFWWYHGEPNNGKGDEDCVHISASRDYRWNDRNCDVPTAFICEWSAAVTQFISDLHCPDGYLEYEREHRCFKAFQDTKSWQEARGICQSEEKGDLASITSEYLNLFFLEKLYPDPQTDFWIGMNDKKKEGQFRWLDSSRTPLFTYWQSREPNDAQNSEDCVMIKADSRHHWNDADCDRELSFICERQRDFIDSSASP